MSKKKNISTYHPFDFKNQFIDFTLEQQVLKASVSDFLIHNLRDKSIDLKLPIPPHRKTVNDFFILTQGFAKRQLGIHSYTIQQNEMLAVPKLQVSTTDFYSEDMQGFYCHFSDEFLANTSLLRDWQQNAARNPFVKIEAEATERITALLNMINTLYRSNWLQHKDLIAQYLRTVITELNFQNSIEISSIINKKKDLVNDYIKLIGNHLGQSYRIAELAEMLHVSPNHLNKVVKEALGKSAQSVYNEIVLQEAKVLLLQSSKDISEIAFELGFNDASYFGKFFKKLTQLSPLEYRKMIEKYQ